MSSLCTVNTVLLHCLELNRFVVIALQRILQTEMQNTNNGEISHWMLLSFIISHTLFESPYRTYTWCYFLTHVVPLQPCNCLVWTGTYSPCKGSYTGWQKTTPAACPYLQTWACHPSAIQDWSSQTAGVEKTVWTKKITNRWNWKSLILYHINIWTIISCLANFMCMPCWTFQFFYVLLMTKWSGEYFKVKKSVAPL